MIRRLLLPALLAAVPVFPSGCKTNPHTGRTQIMLLSEDQEVRMGLEAYDQVSKEAKFVTDPRLTEGLQRVGKAIAAAANKPDYAWEFKLIKDDKTVNAWCLPGGKIAFYTAIYPVLENEHGLAIVMGHEVSHALLRHGGERVSHHILASVAVATGSVLARDSKYRDVGIAALGAGVTVGFLLPYSRKHESEADKFGLELAARAGYDPAAGVRVWERMAALGGGRPPEWLSTHPDPENRIQNMRAWMPEMRAIYDRSDKKPNYPLPRVVGG